MKDMFCAVGCPLSPNLFIFPSRKHDEKRRKSWLDFFDIEEPNTEYVFACDRHFSHLQTTKRGLRTDAVPDIPVICDGTSVPFRRKQKNWRTNVVVVTPRDPEFSIYRHETGVFPQNLFNLTDTVQPAMQMPIIKSVSCSMSTQTNTRLCGSVQISDVMEEYRLNCFYCSEIFPIQKWSKFIKHLKQKHFKKEEAFNMTKYLLPDHDYTAISSSGSSQVKSSNINMIAKSVKNLPSPQPVLLQPVVHNDNISQGIFKNHKPPPPLISNPHKPFNKSLADQLINLLNETILSPNFLHTEDDNILIIKNTGSTNIETSNFLTNLMNAETDCTLAPTKPEFCDNWNNPTTLASSSKYTRPIYTLNYGRQDIPSRRHSLLRDFVPPLPKNKMFKLVQKRIAQQALKNINVFEKVYKTVKTRPPKVVDLIKDLNEPKGCERNSSNVTPLSRCLKRTITETIEATNCNPFSIESHKQKPSEIVFEFTPKDIVDSLIENMQKYPVLWKFHDQPFQKDYNAAIEELCQKVKEKWFLNISKLKMRRSINRILQFYRCMLPCESIEHFEDYFDKCALFLPSSVDEIPRARCAYCCICYKKDSELRKHMIQRHKSLKWPYKCQQCLERFRESDEYELHKRLTHFVELFKCDQCSKRFSRRNLYNKHVSSHQRTIQRRLEAAELKTEPITYSHVCNVCNKQFRTRLELNRHELYHGEKKYKCHMCPKAYSLNMTLKLHLKRHRKELDFMCEICGKGFIRKYYLKEHMDTHTGAKITCNICNLKLRKGNLYRHLRLVHVAAEGTIESTFRAKSHRYKKLAFPQQYNKVKRTSEKLPRHYNCKVCKIPFVRLKLLKDHNKQFHSDVQTISCKMCNINFRHLQNLKRHYRFKHKLHIFQIFKLVDLNEDLNTVLATKVDECVPISEIEYIKNTLNNQDSVKKSTSQNYFAQGRMHSDEIQDEIMKAVENIDQQEMKVDDEHSMNEFFTDLLKIHKK